MKERAKNGIKYVSYHEASGYARAARSFVLGLHEAGIPVTWTPMVRGRKWRLGYEPHTGTAVGNPELDALCNRPIPYDTVIVHTTPEYLPHWRKAEPNKRILHYTVWETDRLPRHWFTLLNTADEIIVPCQWNRQVFQQCGVTSRIHVIPHILDSLQNGDRADFQELDPTLYVFYTIGTWIERKAIGDLVRCYLDTFTPWDPVLLIVKTSRWDETAPRFGQFLRSTAQTVRNILRTYAAPPRLLLIHEEISDAHLQALHHRGDCYVSLCHSEGWGLGAFEAAGAGRPVIITGYGGHLDYLNEDNAYLVDQRLAPVHVRHGRKSYSHDQQWAIPDLSHAKRLMRHVFENREEAVRKGHCLQESVRQRFNKETVIPQMIGVIRGEDPCTP
jgi:glycosyltransferase involved in cell wall biosynthesis